MALTADQLHLLGTESLGWGKTLPKLWRYLIGFNCHTHLQLVRIGQTQNQVWTNFRTSYEPLAASIASGVTAVTQLIGTPCPASLSMQQSRDELAYALPSCTWGCNTPQIA